MQALVEAATGAMQHQHRRTFAQDRIFDRALGRFDGLAVVSFDGVAAANENSQPKPGKGGSNDRGDEGGAGNPAQGRGLQMNALLESSPALRLKEMAHCDEEELSSPSLCQGCLAACS